MAKEAVFQGSFTGGELSAHLHDRIDLEIYYAGSAYLRNFVPLPHGPITRRRGSQFIAESATEVRLLPFSFSVSQSFVLEIGDRKMRIYYQDGIVVNSDGTPLEVLAPWELSDLPNLQWAQYKDWLYIVDGRHQPYAVKRYSNIDWRVEALEFIAKPEEWADENWPQFVAFFEQRAIYAGTAKQPQQLWFSMTGLPENFTLQTAGETQPDNAFTYTIFSEEANGITFISVTDSLLVGTAGSEFRVGSSISREALTPTNIQIRPQTFFGSARIRPIKAGSNTAFLNRSRTRLRIAEYSLAEEQYVATDLTLFASHILQTRVKEMSVQSTPDTYFWAITDSGLLIGCTFEKQQKVLGWHIHETQGFYRSVCVLPTTGDDIVYVSVERSGKYYTEMFTKLTEPIESAEDVTSATYLDSFLTYNGEATKNITGLEHLEGYIVSILTDGAAHPDLMVLNGALTLNWAAKDIRVGLAYNSHFTSLIPQSQEKLTLGQVRRINEAIIALENSHHFYFSAKERGMEQLEYFGPTRIMNKAKLPSSRHDTISISGASAREQQLNIWSDDPFPLTIRGIVYFITPSMV